MTEPTLPPNNYFRLVRASRLYPVLVLERAISVTARHALLQGGAVAILLALGLFWTDLASQLIFGLLALLLAAVLALWLLELFFRSYYYDNIITNRYGAADRMTFTVGRILYRARRGRALAALLLSPTGREILRRLGIPFSAARDFLREHDAPEAAPLVQPPDEVLTLRQLVAWLWQVEPAFREWLLFFDLEQDDWLGATAWVVREIEDRARAARWWSRENLLRGPGLADDWSYGETYLWDRYARDLVAEVPPAARSELGLDETENPALVNLQTVLCRSQEANALIVGPAGAAAAGLLNDLAAALKSGTAAAPLRGRRLLLLLTARFLADCPDRSTFERQLTRLLEQALHAGNAIVALDNLPALLSAGEALGADATALLDIFLQNRQLPVIALADEDSFHRLIEPRLTLMQRFEKVNAPPASATQVLPQLEREALALERRHGVTITYQALAAIVQNAEQYFGDEAVADQALDLLVEAVPRLLGRGRSVLDRAMVEELVASKTNVPLGAIGPEEKQKLLGLEAALARRVVGQKAALAALAGALRRLRAGVRNPKRPIGSFLFLGPTGVGKTETAKALAAVYFGREEALLRLDMSEYQSADALPRLIGSVAGNEPGILANLLRQNQFGVLLLDEFEKTNREVLNLFLQILDEGFFADTRGRRVNARNLIFIATSNAGAELIWQMVGAGQDPALRREELVNHLIESGVYRPELLNRFDDIVIYHPLNDEELRAVARLLLARLAARLVERGIGLTVDDTLVGAVARGGSNRQFGARPMQRLIQDQVEQRLAEALIRNEIRRGQTANFGQNFELTVH